MKKVFAILFVAGMATFAACTSSENTDATETVDSVAAAVEDTTAAIVDSAAAAIDSAAAN